MTEATPAWLRQPERGSVLGLQFLSWLARRAPDLVADALLWAVALWFATFPGPIVRRGSCAYLAAVLGRTPRFASRLRRCSPGRRQIYTRPAPRGTDLRCD